MSNATANYVTVATVDEVPPGSRLVFQVGRRWIVLFNVEGAFYAIEDLCSHADYALSDGMLNGTLIECHAHGACFDIRDGSVQAPPAVTGVKAFAVRVEGSNIQVAAR